MSSAAAGRPPGMTDTSTTTPTTVTSIGVAMFTVADQDAALAFYTEKLGYEVRGDARFGEHGEHRWLEVAPPGSLARLALNPPMGGQPGGGGIGVETPDVLAEHRRLSALGVDVDPEPMRTPGAPLLFMMRDPDGNHIAVVEAPQAGCPPGRRPGTVPGRPGLLVESIGVPPNRPGRPRDAARDEEILAAVLRLLEHTSYPE